MFFESRGFPIFSIADIEVSVSLWYGLLMIIIVGANPGVSGLIFALAVTISILIHEFGHAVPSKMYSLEPSILLHGFGGLCRHRPSDSDWKDILIVVAGPLVEIVFGIAAFGALAAIPALSAEPLLYEFVWMFAWVSVVWGGINLLIPLYPLDGGQLLHLGLRRFVREDAAQKWTLYVSVFTAIPVGILGFYAGFWLAGFLAFFIVLGNVQLLQSGVRLIDRRAKVRASSFVRENVAAAEEALEEGDFREAARLCHLVRSGNETIPGKTMARIWEVLGVATTQMGEYEEALGWLKRAPDTRAVREARETCRRGKRALEEQQDDA